MGTLSHMRRSDVPVGRHFVVAAVLFSFALMVAAVTLLVLTAIGRVADYSNQLDDARSQETTAGAIKTFQSQLAATLDDYAAWDDAARNVYSPEGTGWVISNYGDMTVNSSLFSIAVVIDDAGRTILGYRQGKPLADPMTGFFDPAISVLIDRVKATPAGGTPEASGFVRTADGIAAVSVGLVREKSGGLSVPDDQRRYLIFGHILDAAQIRKMGETYVIGGLQLGPPDSAADYSVLIKDPLGAPIGRLTWPSKAPGDASYAQARPLVVAALGLVGLFFVVLSGFGMVEGRRLRAEEAQAREQTLRDRLSGLSNREGLRIGTERLLAEAAIDGSCAYFLYIDLDGFKEVNDVHGHAAGDQLIRAVAGGLMFLAPENAILARVGGDEFAVTLNAGEDGEAFVRNFAESVLDFLAEAFEIGQRRIGVGASIGIASSPEGVIDREELVRRADLAMYRAKQGGRGRIARYEAAMDFEREARDELELDLRAAIENEELTVVYLPIVDARHYRMTGVEALARWSRPGHGPVSPETFIPVAESSGLIEAIGLFVLGQACRAATEWPELKLAVNVSPGQFRNPAFGDYVRSVLDDTGIDARRLTLEIAESYISDNPSRTRQHIERLKLTGVRVALDDFGFGSSSIGYLRQFGFDRIKIDRALTSGIMDDKRMHDMLRASVALARSLDVPVTAEGIETGEQAATVTEFGCDEMQGYFFGKPMTADEIGLRLSSRAERGSAQKRGGRVDAA